MKVLAAYDGSVYADAALCDLRRAGLPRNAEISVVSVADPVAASPAFSEFDLFSLAASRAEAVLSRFKTVPINITKI